MNFERLGKNIKNGLAGIERRVGILENHLNLPAQRERHSCGREARNFVVSAENFPGIDALEAQNGSAERGFPATGFAYESHGFSGGNLKRNMIDCGKGFFVPEAEKASRSRRSQKFYGDVLNA